MKLSCSSHISSPRWDKPPQSCSLRLLAGLLTCYGVSEVDSGCSGSDRVGMAICAVRVFGSVFLLCWHEWFRPALWDLSSEEGVRSRSWAFQRGCSRGWCPGRKGPGAAQLVVRGQGILGVSTVWRLGREGKQDSAEGLNSLCSKTRV